jgi:hypothetical protein
MPGLARQEGLNAKYVNPTSEKKGRKEGRKEGEPEGDVETVVTRGHVVRTPCCTSGDIWPQARARLATRRKRGYNVMEAGHWMVKGGRFRGHSTAIPYNTGIKQR